MRRKLILYISLGVLTALVLGWSYINSFSNTSQYMTHVSINLKWVHQAQFAGIYTAIEKGFYRSEMIDVEVIEGGPDNPAIDAVLSGKAKFGIAGADDIIVQISKGAPLRAIAVVYQKNPVVYFSRENSGITTPYDFVGKNVAIREGTGSFYIYLSILEDLGIDRGEINEIPVNVDLEPFLNGSVDVWPGFIMNEPIIAKNNDIDINLIRPEDYGIDIYGDLLFTTVRTIEREPALVRSFVRATIRGWEYSIDNQDEAVDYVMKYAKNTTRDHQDSMLSQSVPFIRPDISTEIGDMSFSEWLRTYQIFQKLGIVTGEVDVKSVYNVQFLE